MKILFKQLHLVVLAVGLVNSGHCAQVTHTFSGGTGLVTSSCPAVIPWVDYALSVPQFDSQLGTLTKVTVELTTSVTSSGSFGLVDDGDESEVNFSPILNSFADIPLAGQSVLNFSGFSNIYTPYLHYGDTCTFTDDYVTSGVQSLEILGSEQPLDDYIGSGDTTHTLHFAGVYYLAQAIWHNWAGSADSNQTYTYTVTYDYEP